MVLHVDTQLSQHYILRRLDCFPPLNCLDILVKNQLPTNVWFYFFWTLNSIPLNRHAYLYARTTLSELVSCKIGKHEPLTSFFFKTVLFCVPCISV